jgi:hypothetical protein
MLRSQPGLWATLPDSFNADRLASHSRERHSRPYDLATAFTVRAVNLNHFPGLTKTIITDTFDAI